MSPKLDAAQRRSLMARFKSTGSSPERLLAALLREQGLVGYRLNLRTLAGRPDIVYTRWKVAIFADGEFWHGHPEAFTFGTKGPYWDQKISRNQKRDQVATAALEAAGWTVIRIWSREIRTEPQQVITRLVDALAVRGHPVAKRLQRPTSSTASASPRRGRLPSGREDRV